MARFAQLKTEGGQLNRAIADLLAGLLDKDVVEAVLVPARQPFKKMVMQTLISAPAQLEGIDPFAPVVSSSSAKLLSSLTHRPTNRPVAAVLRSCEVRAFLELVKLHQGNVDDLVLIGIDCHGRYENRDYLSLASDDDDLTRSFITAAAAGQSPSGNGIDIARACRACEHPVADNVDLRLCLIGADPGQGLWVEAVSERGTAALAALGIAADGEEPDGRKEAIAALISRRVAYRDQMLADFGQQTATLEGLSAVLSGCVNCYNCRVACPVCYCRECVFVTDTFRHAGDQYLRWADKRGRIKMPTDTLFYHLTRMVHMSTLCVGCGQCTSACPNDVPVMEIFRSVADRTQARFDYHPGASLEEPQPLAIFHSEEFDEVTGQVK